MSSVQGAYVFWEGQVKYKCTCARWTFAKSTLFCKLTNTRSPGDWKKQIFSFTRFFYYLMYNIIFFFCFFFTVFFSVFYRGPCVFWRLFYKIKFDVRKIHEFLVAKNRKVLSVCTFRALLYFIDFLIEKLQQQAAILWNEV